MWVYFPEFGTNPAAKSKLPSFFKRTWAAVPSPLRIQVTSPWLGGVTVHVPSHQFDSAFTLADTRTPSINSDNPVITNFDSTFITLLRCKAACESKVLLRSLQGERRAQCSYTTVYAVNRRAGWKGRQKCSRANYMRAGWSG